MLKKLEKGKEEKKGLLTFLLFIKKEGSSDKD